MIQDSIYNTKIVYLYVHSFEWKDQMNKEASSGHPKAKKLYRAIYNTDSESYRVIYEVKPKESQVYMTFVESLQSKDEEKGYLSNISLITADNILDFPLTDKEIDLLFTWLTTDNKDLKDILGDIGAKEGEKPKKTQPGLTKQGMSKKPSQELIEFINVASKLHDVDPMMFGTVFDVMLWLIDDLYIDAGAIDTHWLKLHEEHGAGTNVTAAIEKLSRYMGNNRRTGLLNEDLMNAIRDLLTEKGRRLYHQIE